MADVHRRAGSAIDEAMHLGEADGIRRAPELRLEEICAEGQEILCPADGVVRMASPSEHGAIDACSDSYLIACMLPAAARRRLGPSRPRPEDPDFDPLTSAIFRPWLAFISALTLSATCFSARPRRGACPESALTIAIDGRPCRPPAPDAERPACPRSPDCLELDDAAVALFASTPHPEGHRTGGREVRRHPGDDLFGRRHQREELTCRTATTAGRRDGARGGDDLEERPAVYLAPWPAHRLISFERSSSEG